MYKLNDCSFALVYTALNNTENVITDSRQINTATLCKPVKQLSVHLIQAATGHELCHREHVMNAARSAHRCN